MDSNKHIIEETIPQVGHLPELFEYGNLLIWMFLSPYRKNFQVHVRKKKSTLLSS